MSARPTLSPRPARILLSTFPFAGHVHPGLPIARALVERGHEVRWYTGREFRAAVEATGARFEPICAAHDPADQTFDERYPERAGLEGIDGFKFDVKHLFLDEVPGQVADLQRLLADFPADVVLGDTGSFAPAFLHELGGPVWATFGITALTLSSRDTAPFGTGQRPATNALGRLRQRAMSLAADRVLFRDVDAHRQDVRRQVGLPPDRSRLLNGTLSPYLYLQSSTEAFEYPRRDLAPQVHFIGPLLPDAPAGFEPPAWWGELDGPRPVVLVTQGTFATDLADLVEPSLAGLAGEPYVVVATADPAALGGGPTLANAHVQPFVPFAPLLPHVDVMVTNGGYGGTQFALARGVPLVVAGTTEDKPEIAARVAWSGAGIDLATKRPTSEQVRDAVARVLGDPTFRSNAERIRDDYALHDAPAEAAHMVERLAFTGQPVVRPQLDATRVTV